MAYLKLFFSTKKIFNSKQYQYYFLFCVFYWYRIDSVNCVNDKLRISGKGEPEKITTTCGKESPISVVFEGVEVYIEFTTNGAISDGGFLLTYKLINISTPPEGTWK